MVELDFKGHVVVHIVADTERRPKTQAYVVIEHIVGARVHILITEKWPPRPELFGKLRIEGRRVEVERAADQGVPDQKTFVQKFDAVSHVYRIGIDDCLAVSRRRSWTARRGKDLSAGNSIQDVIADLIVVIGASDLQSTQGIGEGEKRQVCLIAVVLISQ